MRIEIRGKEYNLPIHWHEVTLNDILGSNKLLDDMPEKLYQETFEQKKVEHTDDDQIDNWKFYRKWVGYWCKLPEDYDLSVEDLQWLYSSTQIFMGSAQEDDIMIFDTISFKGVEYGLPEPEVLLNGNTKQMADSSYGEFIESAQLMTKINQLKDGDLTALPMLTAILYRPIEIKGWWWWRKRSVSKYKESEVMERMEAFKQLPMDKVWSAYFFLIGHLGKYVSGLQTSLKGEGKRTDTVGI